MPTADYQADLPTVQDVALALPAELTGPVRQLGSPAAGEPLVASRDLRFVIAQTGQDAVRELAARNVPLKVVAAALGASEAAARYLNDCLHPCPGHCPVSTNIDRVSSNFDRHVPWSQGA